MASCLEAAAWLREHKLVAFSLLSSVLFVVCPVLLAVQYGAEWTGSVPTGDGWGHGVKAMPTPVWALDAAARANASLVAIDVPLGSRLEVYASADGWQGSGVERVLSFRLRPEAAIDSKKKKSFKPATRDGAAELVVLAACWSAAALVALSGPLFLALAYTALKLGTAARAEGDKEAMERRVAQVLMACLGVLGVLVVVPLAATAYWRTFAAPLQVDGMELRAGGVSLIRSWGRYGSVASHLPSHAVSTVVPFAATAGLFELKLVDLKMLHHTEETLLHKLIKKHYRALAHDRVASTVAKWKDAAIAHIQSGVIAIVGE